MPLTDVKKIQRRAKESERALARWLVRYDGLDPMYSHVASSTGRVGHLTGLQFDVPSITYDAENKNMVVPATLWKAWKQVCNIAKGHKKEPLLRLEPSNADKKGVPVIHMITEERHKELLESEKYADKASYILESMPASMDDMLDGYDDPWDGDHA